MFLFLLSTEALSQTASLYSSKHLVNETYIFFEGMSFNFRFQCTYLMSSPGGCCDNVDVFNLAAVIDKRQT